MLIKVQDTTIIPLRGQLEKGAQLLPIPPPQPLDVTAVKAISGLVPALVIWRHFPKRLHKEDLHLGV